MVRHYETQKLIRDNTEYKWRTHLISEKKWQWESWRPCPRSCQSRAPARSANRNDSVLLVRYRRVLGLGGDLPNAFLDGFLRSDVGHGLAMLVSPLVLFFHPLKRTYITSAPENRRSCHGPSWHWHQLLPSLPHHWVTSRHGICFQDDGLRTNRPYLSTPKKLVESWFTFPGTKIFHVVLFPQLQLVPNLSLSSQVCTN